MVPPSNKDPASPVDSNGRPLPFTRAHNTLIETSNHLPPGTLNRAYREAFGSQVNGVIRDLLEQRRLDQEVDLRTRFNRGMRSTSPRERRRLVSGESGHHQKKSESSAERVAQVSGSSIRKGQISPTRAQQELRQPAAPVQRGGSGGRRKYHPGRPQSKTELGESFRRAAAQRPGGAWDSAIAQLPLSNAGGADASALVPSQYKNANGGGAPSMSIYGSPEQRRAAAEALNRGIQNLRATRIPREEAVSRLMRPDDVSEEFEEELADLDAAEEARHRYGGRNSATNALSYAPQPTVVTGSDVSDVENGGVRANEHRRGKYGDIVDEPTPTFGASPSPSSWLRSSRPSSARSAASLRAPLTPTRRTEVQARGCADEEYWPGHPHEFKRSQFTEGFSSTAPLPVSARSPLFGNVPRSDTNSNKRNWLGGLFGSKAPASHVPISTGQGRDGGLFGDRPATPAPNSPPGGGIFGMQQRNSGSSFESSYGADDGLGELDEETLEAIRLARRARRGDVSPLRRGKYGLSCFGSSSSRKKMERNKSSGTSRPVLSPEYAPRRADNNKFGGHAAQINGVNRTIPKRSNAVRDTTRNTGAQGVAGMSGVRRTARVETRRAGTGRPKYYEPSPELRPKHRKQRQAPTPEQ